jgi:hypothetical protein
MVHDAEGEAVEAASHIPVLGMAQAMALASMPGTGMMEQEMDHASRRDIALEVLEIRLGTVLVVLETARANRPDIEREVPERLLFDNSDTVPVVLVLEMVPLSRARTGLVVLETVLLSMVDVEMEVLAMVLADETDIVQEVQGMAPGNDCDAVLEARTMARENVLATLKAAQAKLLEHVRALSASSSSREV